MRWGRTALVGLLDDVGLVVEADLVADVHAPAGLPVRHLLLLLLVHRVELWWG
jgi:hypothetical protein